MGDWCLVLRDCAALPAWNMLYLPADAAPDLDALEVSDGGACAGGCVLRDATPHDLARGLQRLLDLRRARCDLPEGAHVARVYRWGNHATCALVREALCEAGDDSSCESGDDSSDADSSDTDGDSADDSFIDDGSCEESGGGSSCESDCGDSS